MVSAQRLFADRDNAVLTDDLNDLSKAYAHSANFFLDSSNPTVFNGDVSRLARSSNTEEYVVYRSPSLTRDVTGFTATGWYWPDEAIADFAFYASADGTAYTPFTPTKTTVSGGGSVWNKVVYQGNGLPEGTKWIKMVFKQNTANYWNPQLGSVEISSVPASGTIVDDLNDWSKTYARSANLVLDGSVQASFNGDASRMARSSNTEEYAVYKAPSSTQRISRFSAEGWFWPDEAVTDFAFYASPDAINYTAVTPSRTIVNASGTVWTKATYTANALPPGTRFLKIVYKHGTVNYWNPQIGRVEYSYE
jgi:hypothetical protein